MKNTKETVRIPIPQMQSSIWPESITMSFQFKETRQVCRNSDLAVSAL